MMRNAIYASPATGFTAAHRGEIDLLASQGWRVAPWSPPQSDKARGLEDGRGEAAFWQEAAASLLALIRTLDSPSNSCCLVGFNLGGSMTAYFSTLYPVKALVVAGSVPRLSDFWPHSDHAVAKAVRNKTAAIDKDFERSTRFLDLTSSLSQIEVPVLIQCGHRDDWLEPLQMQELERIRPINWYDDDHAMLAPATRDSRLDFLRTLSTQTTEPRV